MLWLLLGLMGCKKTPVDEVLTGLPDDPWSNPIVTREAALPWPSDFYLVDDDASATGRRLEIPQQALPEAISASYFEGMDGYSRVQPLLTFFEQGLEPSSLPDPLDIGATTDPGSPVLLVRADDLSLVPVLAERDGPAPEGFKSLILRAHYSLDPDTAYVVLLRDGLRAADGSALDVSDVFRALRDDLPTDSSTVESMRDDFAVVREVIDGLGLEPAEVVQGWSFHTRSRAQVVDPVLAMHDVVAAADLPPWVLTEDGRDGDNRTVRGSIEVPNFLDGGNRIRLDAAGAPIQRGTRTVPFLLTIPDSVTSTRPVLAFGHGFFSSLDEPLWSSLNHSLQSWQMSAITTNFMGFNEDDFTLAAQLLAGPLDGMHEIVDLNLQSQLHFTALHRLVVEQLATDIRLSGGEKALDKRAVHYMGISNGSTQGLTIVAASPSYDRAALVVGGCGWSHFLQRAVDWNTLGPLFSARYQDPLELQLALSITQLAFDRLDGANFADHLVSPRFEGRGPIQVSMHEAVGDSQVNNLLTEWCARSAGVPLVTPSPRDVWGLNTLMASPPGVDVPAALTIYDEGYAPSPVDNTPPADDNGAHESIRWLAAYERQLGAFLEDGTIVQSCDGACDPD